MLDRLKGQVHQPSTKYNYHKVWTNFNEFILKLDKIPESWEEKLTIYCTYLTYICRLKSSTIRSYASAIKTTLITDGYAWNQDLFIMTTFTKICKIHNDTVTTRLPIRHGLLELLLLEVEIKFGSQPYLEALYKVAFAMSYFGLFRIGELTASQHVLKAKNVHEARNKSKYLAVLFTSKTHGEGDIPQKINIFKCCNVFKHKKARYCPVELIQNYTSLRKPYSSDLEQFLIFADGSPLKATQFRAVLKQLLTQLGLNPEFYDTHSFRIGGASDLLRLGYSVTEIKMRGRWRSNAVFKYLRN